MLGVLNIAEIRKTNAYLAMYINYRPFCVSKNFVPSVYFKSFVGLSIRVCMYSLTYFNTLEG